jgi:hypothetical protein
MAQQLAKDFQFMQRVNACMWQESLTRQTDPDPASAALAADVLRGLTQGSTAMTNMIAAFPGLADQATMTKGDGSKQLDHTAISDEDILAQTQANWKTVADLFYVTPAPSGV